ncbi:MAG: NifB/NifX family molybdenum-iron cluster-binding protein [Bacillota bacterium]
MATLVFAVPTAEGKVCRHFGHADAFTLLRVEEGRIVEQKSVSPPPHEPGVLPAWLAELGVTHVIAAGMGYRAQEAFARAGIETVTGAEGGTPEELVEAYLTGRLVLGENPCRH